MGEGMKRIAKAYGGMRVSARGVTCDYVAKGSDAAKVIRARVRSGWTHIGETPDGEFLQFTKDTAEADKEEP